MEKGVSNRLTVLRIATFLGRNLLTVWMEHCKFKRQGFVSVRQNELRNLTAKILSSVWKDTEIESKLTPK